MSMTTYGDYPVAVGSWSPASYDAGSPAAANWGTFGSDFTSNAGLGALGYLNTQPVPNAMGAGIYGGGAYNTVRPGDHERFIEMLGQELSGGNWRAQTPNGIGKWQLSERDLQGAKYFSGADDINDFAAGWTGKRGVNSSEDFLNNPRAQRNAVRKFHRAALKEIETYYGEYIGHNIGGLDMTKSGLLAVYHFAGIEGVGQVIHQGAGADANLRNVLQRYGGMDLQDLQSRRKRHR